MNKYDKYMVINTTTTIDMFYPSYHDKTQLSYQIAKEFRYLKYFSHVLKSPCFSLHSDKMHIVQFK